MPGHSLILGESGQRGAGLSAVPEMPMGCFTLESGSWSVPLQNINEELMPQKDGLLLQSDVDYVDTWRVRGYTSGQV